jgi:hypothetical protein
MGWTCSSYGKEELHVTWMEIPKEIYLKEFDFIHFWSIRLKEDLDEYGG